MADALPPDEHEPTDLVAYLDGELSGAAAHAMEHQLARDGAVRAEAAALKQAWDLLDLLPQPEPSPTFTSRTLEKLIPVRTVPSQKIPAARGWVWVRRGLIGSAWAAALVGAFMVGYSGFNRLRPAQPGKAELLRDYQVLENKRLYEHVEDIDEAEGIRKIFNDDNRAPDKARSE